MMQKNIFRGKNYVNSTVFSHSKSHLIFRTDYRLRLEITSREFVVVFSFYSIFLSFNVLCDTNGQQHSTAPKRQR